MKYRRAILLVALMSALFAQNAFAQESNVPVKLQAEAPTFSVSVPTALPVNVAANGTVTVSTNNNIVNNSAGPVKVTKVEVVGKNGWTLQPFNTDFKKKNVGIKEFGFQINGRDVNVDGSCDASSFSAIPGKGSKSFTYSANVAAQTTAIRDQEIAQACFTIAWDATANKPTGPVIPSNEVNVNSNPGVYDANGHMLASWDEANFFGPGDSWVDQLTSKYPNATQLVVPPSNDALDMHSFERCSALTKVVLKDGITRLPDQVFSDCHSIRSIYIPASVEYIPAFAFNPCKNLNCVYYGGTEEQWKQLKESCGLGAPFSTLNEIYYNFKG